MKRLLIATLALSTLHCGYNLVGRGSVLDPSIKTISIPTLENKTTRVEIEQRLTQAVS